MKRIVSLFIAITLVAVCLSACAKSESIFDSIEIVDDEYSIDGIIIGTSTFLETEKVYPEVDTDSFDIEESQALPFFEAPYTLKIDNEEIAMQKRYSYVCKDRDFFYVKEDGEVDYSKVNTDYFLYENYKNYICDAIYIASDEVYDLDKANEMSESLIAEATKKFGEPSETSDKNVITGDAIKIAYWELGDASTLGIGAVPNNNDTFKFAISIYKNSGYLPGE